MEFETVIGLEVHAQLKTESKIFCSCSTKFGAEPNSQVCPVCLGMPGVLPVLNEKALEYAVLAGLATHCKISRHSIFARKNYFYPDLPKGYQISQYEEPLCEDGFVEIELDGERKRIGLVRIHLEEDAGKSIHAEDWVPEGETLVDLNRCGVPLIEIVSKPDIRSPREAYAYLTELKRILEYLGISDCNMEEGSLRCDANVSIRPLGSTELGTKTEVKNMNSFHGVEKALEYEVERQRRILESGGRVVQETMLWNEKEGRVIPMRSKEEAHDYRYFPEPDLVPVELDEAWIRELVERVPELPLDKKARLIREYRIPEYDAEILVSSRPLAEFFEQTCKLHSNAKAVSNFIMGEVLRYLREEKVELGQTRLTPSALAELLSLVEKGTISLNVAKNIFRDVAASGRSPEKIVQEKGLAQVSDESELRKIVGQVIEQNPKEVEKFLAGKEQIIGFFVGQVMRQTRGRANPKVVNALVRELLEKKR
ncbi:MAG TPA: Asp-tRNA(Asn)/Glu-tRNA(Gln) amidotransferase subunit GatB [Bacteroidetes bacterium]|nr:Asp-tRNA(Asn)/Glu-tRNA(Gln) amidotransferase subunit GatB [Bacteroidota bacterium]